MFRSTWRWLTCVSAIVAVLALTACGSSSKNNNQSAASTAPAAATAAADTTAADTATQATTTAGDADLQKTADEAFGPGTDVASLDPVIKAALQKASTPLTDEQNTKMLSCLKEAVCNLGNGKVTIGYVETYATALPYRIQTKAAFLTQALHYPEIGKVIWTEAGGDVQKLLSNFRSLVTQKVDVIQGNMDLGDAALPVARQASRAGVKVVITNQAIPSAKLGKDGDVLTTIAPDICKYGRGKAEAAVQQAGGKKGYAVMLTGVTGNPFGAVWRPCAKKVFDAAGWTTSQGNTEWTAQGEQKAAASIIAGKTPDAILYDYTPEAMINKFLDAGKTPPSIHVGAPNAGSVRAWQKATKAGHAFFMTQATGQLFFIRTGVTADVMAAAGEDLAPKITVPDNDSPTKGYADKLTAELPNAASFNSVIPDDIMKKVMASGG